MHSPRAPQQRACDRAAVDAALIGEPGEGGERDSAVARVAHDADRDEGHPGSRRGARDHVALHVRNSGAGLSEKGELLAAVRQRAVDAGDDAARIRLFQLPAQRLPQGRIRHHEVVVSGRRRRLEIAVPLEGGEPLELVAYAAAIGLLDLPFVDDDGLRQHEVAGAEARIEPGGEAVAHQQPHAARDHGIGRLSRALRPRAGDRDPEVALGQGLGLGHEARDDADAGPVSHDAPRPRSGYMP